MRTEITLVLDASGSMSHMTEETIQGVNKFIREQKEIEGKCRVTVIQFDSDVSVIVDRKKLNKLAEIDEKSYVCGGLTALYDAVGLGIRRIQQDAHKDAKVILVIMTDGMENASKEYNHERINKLLSDNPEWEVVFLAANIDAHETGSSIGVMASKTMNYHSNLAGTRSVYETVSCNVAGVRSGTKEDMSIEQKDIDAQKDAGKD